MLIERKNTMKNLKTSISLIILGTILYLAYIFLHQARQVPLENLVVDY